MSTQAIGKYLIPDLPSATDVLPYLQGIDETRWYSNFGPLVCEFEERLQALLSAQDLTRQADRIHLVTLASGYHALEIGLHFSGIARGQRVLIPAITFSACPLAVQHAGFEAVLADVDPINWTLTPKIARAAAAHMQIAAVMPVAIYGVPLPTSEWDEFSRDTGIPVVIDAAAAFEAQSLPQHGLVAYSFHATKPFGIGEGGILVGRDSRLISKARQYSNFGMIDRICHIDGANTKMSEFHAAVGLAQIKRWNNIKQRRSHLLKLYFRHLEPFAEFVSFQPSIEKSVVSCLMLLLKEPLADIILAGGKQTGVAWHRTYLPPLYRHPYFKHLTVVCADGTILPPQTEMAKKVAGMSSSERLLAHLIGVPFHPFMNDNDVASIVKNLSLQFNQASA